MEREFGLHAGGVVGQSVEGDDHSPQLQRIGVVLGVEDCDDLAGGEVQPVVARFRFGSRVGRRHEEDRDHITDARCSGRFDGDVVVLFEQQQNLEFIRGILQRGHRSDEVGHHFRFVVRRHQNCVGRQLLVRDGERFVVADGDDGAAVEPTAEQQQAIEHRPHIAEGAQQGENDQRGRQKEHGRQDRQGRKRQQRVALPRVERHRCRGEWMLLPEPVHGVVQCRRTEFGVGVNVVVQGVRIFPGHHCCSFTISPAKVTSMSRSLYSGSVSDTAFCPRSSTASVLAPLVAMDGAGSGNWASGS